jgi:pilus assembly protein CpaF
MISKNLLRSDADYFIIAEARDGIALDTAVRIARKGIGRMKITFHTRDPRNFPEDVAVEIARSLGGDIRETALRVAGSFDYLFHFVTLRAENRKVLKGIYEMGICCGDVGNADGRRGRELECEYVYRDENPHGYYIREICRYDYDSDDWRWTKNIAADKRVKGEEGDRCAFADFESLLGQLSLAGGVRQ